MWIYHSTEFEQLSSILETSVLLPVPVRREESEVLANLGVRAVWFSLNLYPSNNVFGQYAVKYCSSVLVKGAVVPLGEINKAKTYLSVDEPFAEYVADKLGVSVDKNGMWLSEQKANIIIGCHIPLMAASEIEICASWTDRNGIKRDREEGDVLLSKGRLVALALTKNKGPLDKIIVKPCVSYAQSFLYTLVGSFDAFEKRRRVHNEKIGDSALPNAIECILSGNWLSAKEYAACIGDVMEIATRIACLCRKRFGWKFSVEEIMAEYGI